MEIPLFPLHVHLQPGQQLALRIFEPRYLKMISQVAGKTSAFGIVPIISGSDAGEIPLIETHGMLASIVDFQNMPDGLLGITVLGERGFKIQRTWVMEDGLLMGKVSPLHNA
ncbi:peptidase S16, lon-like protein [Magnetococcus marinus MC-1]|uniref:Peptidase S16, lon-like protein n=1 Tax=Magnetococcus marinus (strain ATCC BAA-1437 / JCM 17883 / MC-1) TaxID=156889 RepID=A0L855_MAGMM|nr:LON peptidase substrate-binding domain-containing protein [Magnetococcus marinus]ABK44148.1 peptidase S16, lon-like protein [Magnetococcus marinus MC-1]